MAWTTTGLGLRHTRAPVKRCPSMPAPNRTHLARSTALAATDPPLRVLPPLEAAGRARSEVSPVFVGRLRQQAVWMPEPYTGRTRDTLLLI